MAMTGILRPGFAQIRVLDMEEALSHYVDRVGLVHVETAPDGRVYLRAYDEFDRHSIVLRPASEAGLDLMAFRVADATAMEHYASRVREAGYEVTEIAAGEQPGVGRRLGFTIPSGHRIELFAEMDRAETGPQTTNPDLWHDAPRGLGAQWFDHALLYGPDIEATVRFFTEVLDFSLTERADTPDGLLAAFLTCSTKAHDIAFVSHPEPGRLHHISFHVEDWAALGHAADVMTRYDMPVDIGPTRHGITRGKTIYFFDPSGNRNEVFTGGYVFYPDHPVRQWDERELGKAIFYYERAINDRFMTVVT